MKFFGRSVGETPGAGAAGGLGAGCDVFLGARLIPGIEYIFDYIHLKKEIAEADLIVTGEGMLDEQSMQGKVVGHIAEIAKIHNKPVKVICGQHAPCDAHNILLDKVVTLASIADSVEASISNPLQFIPQAVKNIF
jgi:glycerate kinase